MQPERSSAVVVGGGIVGAATLYYLAERGCERPLLLERDTLASGSTGYCAGGVRTLFSDELNIRIGLESIRRLQRFEEEVGAAIELGARVEQSCPVTRIVVRDGRVAGVETPRGTIETERVICAAGVWSRELAATAGVELPVEPERRFMFFTEEAAGFPLELPLTIDFSTGFYFHREGGALALGGREQSLEELAPLAVRRVPSLETIGVRSSWWGFYEMSPDHNAIVGAAERPSGLFYATGFSGHGFQPGAVICGPLG